jgi:hypothetical protein
MLITLQIGCKKPSEEELSIVKKEGDFWVYTTVPDGQLVSVFYQTHSPKEIFLLNHQQMREGYGYQYHKNGVLKNKSWWENGKKEGEELIYDSTGILEGKYQYHEGKQDGPIFRYENGILKSHQIKKSGKLLYEGLYKGPEKYLNKLCPFYIEEFFFEDKYYAKLMFPFDYLGQMEIQAKGTTVENIEQLKDNTFQLVINDALDLTDYELRLSYYPAPSDTLVHSTYIYKHRIFTY